MQRMYFNAVIKLEALKENYGRNLPSELETVLVNFQEHIIDPERIDKLAVEQVRDARSLTEITQISAALGLDVVIALDDLMETHTGIQSAYFKEVSNFIGAMIPK